MSFKAATLALALTAFGVSPAVAQEQENPSTPGQIPDPGTYQGSTVLQQQSDQQDQQFRQQQQEPTYQQPTQSYSGGQRNNGSSQSQFQMCLNRVVTSRAFAPLTGKIALGSTDPQAIQLFNNHSRPTATEKTLIMRWAEERRHCQAIGIAEFRRPTSAELLGYNRWGFPTLLSLVRQLVAGQLTYGQFNYRRAMNQLSLDHYRAANR